jgi:hypothetical protein
MLSLVSHDLALHFDQLIAATLDQRAEQLQAPLSTDARAHVAESRNKSDIDNQPKIRPLPFSMCVSPSTAGAERKVQPAS